LTSADASARLLRDGPNTLPAAEGPHPVRLLVLQLTHLFALMLWLAAGLAVLAGMPQLAVAIVVVVIVNGVFAFLQEYRADQAAARLRELVPARTQVRRDGAPRSVSVAEVVVGDVVLLEAGERVCADLVLAQAHSLAVDESLLTGESEVVHAPAQARLWCGTFVTEGEAEGVVVATGVHTRLAGIAALTMSARPGHSPLTDELNHVVRVVAVMAAGVGTSLSVVSLALGLSLPQAFLFGLGVMVALVPEGLLPTVTLSLARGAQRMADRRVLVRRLEAVETLGATTFICTDKTGTVTLNQMSAVGCWTPSEGSVTLATSGYDPTVPVGTTPGEATRTLASAAASCVRGRVHREGNAWRPHGDPMEVALDVLARRLQAAVVPDDRVPRRCPYTAARRRSSVVVSLAGGLGEEVRVLGPPEVLAPRCRDQAAGWQTALDELTSRGLRVIAVARRSAPPGWRDLAAGELEQDLELLGLVALEDPPRLDVAEALGRCHEAGIRVAMVTGDHPATALAVAREVGLAGPATIAVTSGDLPPTDAGLAALMTRADGVVVARVSPEDKLRIARALRAAGHVVAMTGDGVNDGPALRTADVGVAMGASGSDVAREAADIVLLDDHFASIVAGIELGRATFTNIRRFLTYHLTDNVAELAPFALWALSGGHFPLAIGVLQVLALDIGTDMLPALALGAEPPSRHTMVGPVRSRRLVTGAVLGRAFGLLGPTEAVLSLATFTAVLHVGGWRWGQSPPTTLLATASGAAFVAIAVGQLANALACRSWTRPVWSSRLRGNRLLGWALAVDAVLCLAFVAVPPLAELLGGSWPPLVGLAGAAVTVAGVVLADAAGKAVTGGRLGLRARGT
jgi:calcium-translocating P-type ATPase